ncbi:rhodanese-related sulfurtransferase [Erythrobacter arachoides]|uniref:tRNA uridine(34) hydroxylase n=1 Tax=Aurantiacibacter arachoides TaxID=1850444 RepID=A0A844ZXQ3_9SPHN|nr:rhodanese-related sulfurtransferase [Aurantiacibacter arachoides]MXO92675.1 rhodanese-related sulfurtransferase [Aurantiacibacter arachoides]GGD55311.1 UPF0176 protein [Aurantiacibacter arachoides]
MANSTQQDAQPVCVAALYRFASLADCESLRAPLWQLCSDEGIKGTLLLASEGINGTIAGSPAGIESVVAHIRNWPGCAELAVKYSAAAVMPFHRLKVRIKAEIVTMGQPGIDPATNAGTYVEPGAWNALLDDPDTIVIDTRNDYEVAIGSFPGAIDPGTATFRDFAAWFERERGRLIGSGKPPKVAMFCTGGIRCEKASAFLKKEGLDDVFHLKGGILAYLEQVAESASRWQGECFVFDQRVAVGQGLAAGTHELCFACRRPVSPSDMRSPHFEAGVSCAACHGERTEAQRASYRERQAQEKLAARQGRAHVGAVLARTGDDLAE